MEYHAGKESTSSALTAFEYVCNQRQRLMAKPNFEACEAYLKFLGVLLGNTIFTCLGTRIQFFDIATTRSFFKLYLGRNSLYSTTGVHMGVGN